VYYVSRNNATKKLRYWFTPDGVENKTDGSARDGCRQEGRPHVGGRALIRGRHRFPLPRTVFNTNDTGFRTGERISRTDADRRGVVVRNNTRTAFRSNTVRTRNTVRLTLGREKRNVWSVNIVRPSNARYLPAFTFRVHHNRVYYNTAVTLLLSTRTCIRISRVIVPVRGRERCTTCKTVSPARNTTLIVSGRRYWHSRLCELYF